MASSILLKFPKNTEVQSKPIDVEEALSRVRRPLDQTRVNLSVMGVYALPEAWKTKIAAVSYRNSNNSSLREPFHLFNFGGHFQI